MTSTPPPPMPVPNGPTVPEVPVTDPPRVPGSVVFLGASVVVCLVLALLCVGALTGTAVQGFDNQVAASEARLERRRAEAFVLRQADQALQSLADQLESLRDLEFSYPVSLPGRPPEDVWGTGIEYRRTAPDRAELRSAGPDRVPGTKDDRVLRLPRD